MTPLHYISICTAAGAPVNSNWEALRSIIAAGRGRQKAAARDAVAPAQDRPAALQTPQQVGSKAGVTPVVAIDCEMVGVGPDGTRSALARWVMMSQQVLACQGTIGWVCLSLSKLVHRPQGTGTQHLQASL